MADLRKIHEQEVFDLVGQRTLSLAEVQPVLETQGFVFEDDFAWLRRTDRVEKWQTETLVDCGFLARGSEVYPDESDFDSLRPGVVATLSAPRPAAGAGRRPHRRSLMNLCVGRQKGGTGHFLAVFGYFVSRSWLCRSASVLCSYC